jgi:hypothetical protein
VDELVIEFFTAELENCSQTQSKKPKSPISLNESNIALWVSISIHGQVQFNFFSEVRKPKEDEEVSAKSIIDLAKKWEWL